jgi:hypothetical protein
MGAVYFFFYAFLVHLCEGKLSFPLIGEIDEQDLNYGLMIDAGSSGSRLSIYCWPDWNFSPTELIPDIETAPIGQIGWSKKITPGIHFQSVIIYISKELALLIKI